MRLLVCGSRHFDDWNLIHQHIYNIFSRCEDRTPEGDVDFTIIEGGAKGADFLARVFAKFVGLPFIEFPADWEKHGKAAGPIRNKQMLDEGRPDLVLAFRAPNSRGTQNMIDQAKAAGVKTIVVDIT